MSLFDYAQRVISRKLENSSTPMLTISMGSSPVMPMAQGGGLSSVQNRLNINGEPHRLAYINPDEESLLKQLGGSGRKIDGIPSYFGTADSGDVDDSIGAAAAEAEANAVGMEDSDPDSAEEGIGIDFDTTPEEAAAAVAAAQAEEAAVAAAIGEQDAYSDPSVQMNAPDLGFFGPGLYSTPDSVFATRDKYSRAKAPEIEVGILSGLLGIVGGPLGALAGKGLDEALDTSFSFSLGKGSPMGYGDTGTGSFDNTPEEEGPDDGQSAGDEIIREKIAAVKKVPVEEVTNEEVERAKRLTAAQRVAGTRLEEILNQIYGSGRGKGLLGIPSSI